MTSAQERSITRYALRVKRDHWYHGVAAFEAAVVVAAVLGFLGMALVSYRLMLKRAKGLVLEAELRHLRASVAFFHATRGRLPSSLEEVRAHPMSTVRVGGGSTPWPQDDETRPPMDPFGRLYRYDPETGAVISQSPGYEMQ